MKVLGLDIGTTTVSAVVTEKGHVLSALTLSNNAFLPSPHPWEKIQDPLIIRRTALDAVEQLLSAHPDVQRIGVTGQMHGIVYLDSLGEPVRTVLPSFPDPAAGRSHIRRSSRPDTYPAAG